MTDRLRVPEQHKYALISVPDLHCTPSLPRLVDLGSGLYAARDAPLNLPDHWKQWLGSLKVGRLLEADLFLVALGRSRTPDILDGENEHLSGEVHRLYLSLLIAVPNIGHFHAMRLTGATHESRTDIREVQDYPAARYLDGSATHLVELHDLQKAGDLSVALKDLVASGTHRRLSRILHAFYAGVRADDAGERLHEFTRCVEGFILPEVGKTRRRFLSRTELFVGPDQHDRMGQIYDIRSDVEHLHDALKSVAGDTKRERVLQLLTRALEAETLARYCLERFLLQRPIWPHLATDADLETFWRLPERDRTSVWGDPFEIARVAATYEGEYLSDEDLGL